MARLISLVLLLGTVAMRAQAQSDPLEGQRVRVTTPDRTPRRLAGRFLTRRADSLVLQIEQREIAIPRAGVTRLEISRGQRSAFGKGARVGVLTGLLAGLIVGGIACATYDIDHGTCLNSHDGGQIAFLGPLGLGVVGGFVVGSVIGLATHTERWELQPVSRLSLAVAASGERRVIVAVALQW
jgi:hypothetical protein